MMVGGVRGRVGVGGGQNLSDSRRMTQFWKSLIRTKNKRKGLMIFSCLLSKIAFQCCPSVVPSSSSFLLWGFSPPTKSEEICEITTNFLNH